MGSYDNCYFAFIDILGFKEMVGKKSCSEILNVFGELGKQYVVSEVIDEGHRIPVIDPNDIHYYIMSDSICIYIEDKIPHALPILTFLCMNIQTRMLCLDPPVFVRGSISRGEVYGDNNVLFGPALVKAYLRAEKLARVPRIITPAYLHEEMTDSFDAALLSGFTYLDLDGFYTNRYIEYFCAHNSMASYRSDVIRFVNDMVNNCVDQSLRDKYLYVKSRIDNSLIQQAIEEESLADHA